LVALFVDKPHDVLDAGTIVPAAVKDHDFTARGELLDVTLHEQLSLLSFTRCRECHNSEHSRAHSFGNRPDGSAFSASVATFKHNNDAQSLLFDPILQMAELDLKLVQLSFVSLALHLGIFVRFGQFRTPSHEFVLSTFQAIAIVAEHGRNYNKCRCGRS